MKIMLGILAFAALAALVGTGLYLRFGLQVLDRPGMENPDAPMLELLSADWEEPCGWQVSIDCYHMEIFFSGKKVYEGSFSFSYVPGEDVNKKTQLCPEQDRFESEDGDFSGVIEDLYTEDGMMYLDMRFDQYGQENGVRRQFALFRADPENGYDPGDVFMWDGDRTYVDNQELYNVIAGDWCSADGRWYMVIFGEANDTRMTLDLDGERVLETALDFTYLLPNAFPKTEFTLDSHECCHGEEPAFAQVDSLWHESGEGNGALFMTITDGDAESETVEFNKIVK
ncbi:MAG: hypothetical protein ACI3XJ_02525 [Oscillospiraceae bacterium]